MSAIVKVLDAISEWCGKIFSWFSVTVIALSLYEVFTRRLLGKPTIWTHEIIAYCFAGAVLLTIGYTLKHKAHANVDILYGYLSPRALGPFLTLLPTPLYPCESGWRSSTGYTYRRQPDQGDLRCAFFFQGENCRDKVESFWSH
jgi:hypothetical protein